MTTLLKTRTILQNLKMKLKQPSRVVILMSSFTLDKVWHRSPEFYLWLLVALLANHLVKTFGKGSFCVIVRDIDDFCFVFDFVLFFKL